MPIEALEITGLRGFSRPGRIGFAKPDGRPGSGLTVIVGPNNAGKSTITEALRLFASFSNPQSISEDKRNIRAGARIDVRFWHTDGYTNAIRTVDVGGAECRWETQPKQQYHRLLVVPSRRYFTPFFGRGTATREQHAANLSAIHQRNMEQHSFAARMAAMQQDTKRLTEFNRLLGRLVGEVPKWHIEQTATSQHYIRFVVGDSYHTSDGLGEGLLSIMFIADALYDSKPGELICVDEPELSLHPTLLRRLSNLFREVASDRQIVISTHSPYFLDFAAIANGARVARVVNRGGEVLINELSPSTGERLGALLADLNNPHVFGLNAGEAFFLPDRVVLVEGQEDVIFYRRILDELGIDLNAEFFGWGTGGADKMELIATILRELGYEKVVGILDANKADVAARLQAGFGMYMFLTIPANDVRTKKEAPARPATTGLIDDHGQIRPEYRSKVKAMFEEIGRTLGDQ